jgi:hypothetical protein
LLGIPDFFTPRQNSARTGKSPEVGTVYIGQMLTRISAPKGYLEVLPLKFRL